MHLSSPHLSIFPQKKPRISRFQLSRADLSYRLTYQGFSPTAAAPAKQVLRFQGSDLGPQSLPLTLPTVAAGGRDRLAVDLMAGLPPTSGSSAVTLTVSTTTPGLVTIYAPMIEYEP